MLIFIQDLYTHLLQLLPLRDLLVLCCINKSHYLLIDTPLIDEYRKYNRAYPHSVLLEPELCAAIGGTCLLEWLQQHNPHLLRHYMDRALKNASIGGHLSAFKFLYKNIPDPAPLYMFKMVTEGPVQKPILMYILSIFTPDHLSIFIAIAKQSAIGDAETLIALCEYARTVIEPSVIDTHIAAFCWGCRRRDPVIRQWLQENGINMTLTLDGNFKQLCASGDLEAVRMVCENNPQPPVEEKPTDSLQNTQTRTSQYPSLATLGLLEACSKGHLDIVRYLLESGYVVLKDDEYFSECWFRACRGNHLDVVKWLWESSYVDCKNKLGLGFDASMLGNSTEVALWLMSIKADSGIHLQKMATYACICSNIRLLEAVLKHHEINRNAWLRDVMRCSIGYVSVAMLQWLLRRGMVDYQQLPKIFVEACCVENLTLANWIMKLKTYSAIDIGCSRLLSQVKIRGAFKSLQFLVRHGANPLGGRGGKLTEPARSWQLANISEWLQKLELDNLGVADPAPKRE